MDRSLQKRFGVKSVAGAVLVMGLVAQAQAIVMSPGKWRSDFRVWVNGKDSTVVMNQLASQLRTAMPGALKPNAGVALNSAGNLGSATVCVPASTAATMTPLIVFKTFAQMNAKCTLAGAAIGDVVSFNGRCDDPVSFTGNVSGKLTVTSNSSWSAEMRGVGRFPDTVLTSLSIPAKSMVTMKTVANSSLLSATCP